MTVIRRRTVTLPDQLTITFLHLPDGCTVSALRQMLAANLYVLAGTTSSPTGQSTGYGAYVGTSTALDQQMVRCGVSLRQWTYRQGRLIPDTVVLINRTERPIDPNALLLIEASLARAISTRHTILNTRTSAPTAALAATRHQRLWAMRTSQRLAGLILGQVFHPHEPSATGGTTREQLIRLVLNQDPPVAMDVDDLLAAAHAADITVAGRTPAQRSRRDVTTREHQGATGCPRLLRTHIGGRAVIYPAGTMSLRQARASYRASHPEVLQRPHRRCSRNGENRAH
ncbi:hypothetical protein ABEG17_08295 [Pedococcus sp. KACC 23699]|uniref:Uncharacterized protein n=1 Tax=Pedococcus sp. KACC 23699 TaxID=3149228 RepID=A0AAU7JY07_9MICO